MIEWWWNIYGSISDYIVARFLDVTFKLRVSKRTIVCSRYCSISYQLCSTHNNLSYSAYFLWGNFHIFRSQVEPQKFNLRNLGLQKTRVCLGVSHLCSFTKCRCCSYFMRTATKSGGPTASLVRRAAVLAAECVQTAQLTCCENLTRKNFLDTTNRDSAKILLCEKKPCCTVWCTSSFWVLTQKA